MVVKIELLAAKLHTMEDVFNEYESTNMSLVINCSSQIPCTKIYRKRIRFKVIFKAQMPENGKVIVRSSRLAKPLQITYCFTCISRHKKIIT